MTTDNQKKPTPIWAKVPDLEADQKEMALTLKAHLNIMHSEQVKEGMSPQDSILILKNSFVLGPTKGLKQKAEDMTIDELWEALEITSGFIYGLRRTYKEQSQHGKR